jgi:hypothetical protein
VGKRLLDTTVGLDVDDIAYFEVDEVCAHWDDPMLAERTREQVSGTSTVTKAMGHFCILWLGLNGSALLSQEQPGTSGRIS